MKKAKRELTNAEGKEQQQKLKNKAKGEENPEVQSTGLVENDLAELTKKVKTLLEDFRVSQESVFEKEVKIAEKIDEGYEELKKSYGDKEAVKKWKDWGTRVLGLHRSQLYAYQDFLDLIKKNPKLKGLGITKCLELKRLKDSKDLIEDFNELTPETKLSLCSDDKRTLSEATVKEVRKFAKGYLSPTEEEAAEEETAEEEATANNFEATLKLLQKNLKKYTESDPPEMESVIVGLRARITKILALLDSVEKKKAA